MRRTCTLAGLLLIGFFALSRAPAEPPPAEPTDGLVPGKEGTFNSWPWQYQFAISAKGTRSEGTHGKLL